MHWWGYSVGAWWSSQLRGKWNVSPGQLLFLHCPRHTVWSSSSQTCFLVSASLSDDRTLKDTLTVFCFVFIKKRKGKYFCAAVWKVSVKSRQSILFIYFFCHSGTRGLSITPVSGQTAPSHELPQTHLQKIRHEIVWLLHHRAICTSSSSSSSSSHLHSFPFCSLPGLHVSGTASPSRPPLAFLFFFFFFASFSYSCQLISTGTRAQRPQALSLTVTPVLKGVCFKVPLQFKTMKLQLKW